jgi:hypothetical protein
MDLIDANGILVRSLAILNVPAYTISAFISAFKGNNRPSFAREAGAEREPTDQGFTIGCSQS